jgi:PAS domain S-box-containing protein
MGARQLPCHCPVTGQAFSFARVESVLGEQASAVYLICCKASCKRPYLNIFCMLASSSTRILVLGQNEAGRNPLAGNLAAAGHHVRDAALDDDFLSLIEEERAELVVIAPAPVVHGSRVCHTIKCSQGTVNIPVVQIVAASSSSIDRAHFLESGADVCLVEPIESRELLACINTLVRLRRAELSAIASNRRVMEVLEGITDAYCALGRDWRFLDLNVVAEQTIFGRAKSELIGASLLDIFPQSRGGEFVRNYERAWSEQRPVHFEARSLLVNRWFEVHAYPSDDRLDIYAKDITERRIAEQNLRRRLALEHLLASISTRFINITRSTIDNAIDESLEGMGRLVKANRSYLFRFSEDMATSNNTHEWCAEGIQPQIERLQGVPCSNIPWWMRHCERGENIIIPRVSGLPQEASAERELLAAQGIQSLAVVPLKHGERLFGFLGFDAVTAERIWDWDDIRLLRVVGEILVQSLLRIESQEALQESEQRFRALADSSPAPIWVTDTKGHLLFINQFFSSFFGVLMEEVRKVDWQRLLHPEDRAVYVRAFLDATSAQACFKSRARVCRVDGHWRWIDARAIPRFSASGEYLGMVGFSPDVTEIVEAETALKLANHQLETLNAQLEVRVAERTAKLQELVREMEGFSYSIAHDLRAPLRAMHGFAQIVLEDSMEKLDERSLDYLRRITTSALRLDVMIQDVLNYSRLVRQGLPLTTVNLDQLVREIIESYPMYQPPGAEVLVQSPLPSVKANISALTQSISNMLENAVKFVAPGTVPRVLIRAESSQSLVRIWVEDNGIGIPGEWQKRIFELFQHYHSQDEYDGRGVGLAIVQKSVERMGGKVGVESEPGVGSRFWIELPCAP